MTACEEKESASPRSRRRVRDGRDVEGNEVCVGRRFVLRREDKYPKETPYVGLKNPLAKRRGEFLC